MPSNLRSRRLKPIVILVILFTLTVLYLTSAARNTETSKFYTNTKAAIQAKLDNKNGDAPILDPAGAASLPESADDVARRLKDQEAAAKARTDQKGDELRAQLGMEELPDKDTVTPKRIPSTEEKASPEKPVGEGPAVAKISVKDQVPVQGGAAAGPETKEEHNVEQELEFILKRSPIIIFSKSWCGFSAKAKRILLEQYKITPAPFVVELDKHELGSELQSALASTTKRRTVPNILINGKSIGGGDDVEELHLKGQLIDKIRSMGGKRIMEVTAVETHAESDTVDDADDDDDDDDEDEPQRKAEI